MADNIRHEERRRQQWISNRIRTLEGEIDDLTIEIANKNEAVASLIRARTISIDKVRKSYAE